MKHLQKGIPAVILAAGISAVSCSSLSETACEESAVIQALAEQRWQEEFEQHVLADEVLSGNPESNSAASDHDHSAEALFSARVDMILAEAETRRRRG